MKTAVAAPAAGRPEHQAIADLLGAWLDVRVQQELMAERSRRDRMDWWKEHRRWWDRTYGRLRRSE